MSPLTTTSAAICYQQQQRTIKQIVDLRGRGLFTSQNVRIRFLPADINSGIKFQRIDLPGRPVISAICTNLSAESRHTVLIAKEARVETVEHVLSALAGLEIDNCLVQLNMPEPPNCDGSASEFTKLLETASPVLQAAPRIIFTPQDTVKVSAPQGAFIEFSPPPVTSNSGSYFRMDYHLKYECKSSIPEQTFIYSHSPENFLHAIAPARTFIEEHEIDFLRQQGLGRLSTHQDLVVYGANGPLAGTKLRFPDESARHKILDFLGDISLCGMKLSGYIKAYKSGHQLNHQLAVTLYNYAQKLMLQEVA